MPPHSEMLKSAKRRAQDWTFRHVYFKGFGIDIGCGGLPFPCDAALARHFPNVTDVIPWDIQDGDAQNMASVSSGIYDFVVSSHCLEHMVSPGIALHNWLRILKPGGYAIITIPDWVMYEHELWPSRFNMDHKWAFTLDPVPDVLPPYRHIVHLPSWLQSGFSGIGIERLCAIRDKFDTTAPAHFDQCLTPAECAIEMILKKL